MSNSTCNFYLSYRYLLELDCDGDPAWDCITNMCKGIVKLLQSCKDEFQSKMYISAGTFINQLMNLMLIILCTTKALLYVYGLTRFQML